MIEYLYNAIRALPGNDIVISAEVTNNADKLITEGCSLVFHDKDRDTMIAKIDGVYDEESEEWTFTIPAELTKGLSGRYWYCIQHEGNSLCFREPIYLI